MTGIGAVGLWRRRDYCVPAHARALAASTIVVLMLARNGHVPAGIMLIQCAWRLVAAVVERRLAVSAYLALMAMPRDGSAPENIIKIRAHIAGKTAERREIAGGVVFIIHLCAL